MKDMIESPWRVSGSPYGAIVCDVPCRPGDKFDPHYGGFLVCESVAYIHAKTLIAAAPEMLDLLKRIKASELVQPASILGRDINNILNKVNGSHEQQQSQQHNPADGQN